MYTSIFPNNISSWGRAEVRSTLLVFGWTPSGIPIRWSQTGFDTNPSNSGQVIPRQVTHFAALVSDLSQKSQDTCHRLFDGEPEKNALRYMRLRTETTEIIVAPGHGCTLVVIQKPFPKATGTKGAGEEEEKTEGD